MSILYPAQIRTESLLRMTTCLKVGLSSIGLGAGWPQSARHKEPASRSSFRIMHPFSLIISRVFRRSWLLGIPLFLLCAVPPNWAAVPARPNLLLILPP